MHMPYVGYFACRLERIKMSLMSHNKRPSVIYLLHKDHEEVRERHEDINANENREEEEDSDIVDLSINSMKKDPIDTR